MNEFKLLMILILPLIGTLMSFYMGTYSEKRRDLINILITGLNLILITVLFPEVLHHPLNLHIKDIMGTGLHLKLDLFRYVFVWVTALVWFFNNPLFYSVSH